MSLLSHYESACKYSHWRSKCTIRELQRQLNVISAIQNWFGRHLKCEFFLLQKFQYITNLKCQTGGSGFQCENICGKQAKSRKIFHDKTNFPLHYTLSTNFESLDLCRHFSLTESLLPHSLPPPYCSPGASHLQQPLDARADCHHW